MPWERLLLVLIPIPIPTWHTYPLPWHLLALAILLQSLHPPIVQLPVGQMLLVSSTWCLLSCVEISRASWDFEHSVTGHAKHFLVIWICSMIIKHFLPNVATSLFWLLGKSNSVMTTKDFMYFPCLQLVFPGFSQVQFFTPKFATDLTEPGYQYFTF